MYAFHVNVLKFIYLNFIYSKGVIHFPILKEVPFIIDRNDFRLTISLIDSEENSGVVRNEFKVIKEEVNQYQAFILFNIKLHYL